MSAAALPLLGLIRRYKKTVGKVFLVRETALNGARAIRSKIDGYRNFFEERDTYLLGMLIDFYCCLTSTSNTESYSP